MHVEPIKQHIGARIHLDPSALEDDSVVERCRDLLEERSVLVFPQLGLDDEQQLAFTDKLGTRVKYGLGLRHDSAELDDFYKVTLDQSINRRSEFVKATFFWHMDGLTTDTAPPKTSLLSARRLSGTGGQTEFASTYAAYAGLPEEEKQQLEGLRAVHTLIAGLRFVMDEPTEEQLAFWNLAPTQEHPIVWTHESGRKSLVIGTQADRIVGMPVADGRALLIRLMEWAARPEFVYRHEWQESDFVVWDNPGVMHRVVPYEQSSGRLMHRTSIAGTELVH